MSESSEKPQYGVEDTSFRTAGGEDGIRQLVDDFYDAMQDLEVAQTILAMHPEDLSVSRDKLARFLCGWLGGPKLFSEKYGSIRLPKAHQHLSIGVDERDAWLHCMKIALDKQAYPEDFKIYMLEQLFVPAERSRQHSKGAK